MTEIAPPTLNTDVSSTPVDIDTTSALTPSANLVHFERRFSLRPEAQQLVDRNILHGTASASIQAHKDELERAMAADNLKKGLASRPERKELEERGILPDEHVAPALLGHKKELEKHMLTDTLNTKLAHRPKPEEVMEKGILNSNEDPRTPN